MSFCLPKEFTSKFIDALKSGKIDPAKLIDMTSAERRAFLEPIVGADNVHDVNALLESKLILKDQKRGLVSWAKQISGITEATRTDILSKINRMTTVLDAETEGAFLEDLAAKKLGADVTFDEAQKIVDGAKALDTAKSQWDPKQSEADMKVDPSNKNAGWKSEDARLDYGLKYTEFQKYISDLKAGAKALTFKEWISSPSEIFNTIAGTTKSVLASLDNSFFGRQGIKTLYTHPSVWIQDFAKSWSDIGKELVKTKDGIEPMDAIKADIYSRPNALNGKYQAAGIDIGISNEEAFPSALPEKIPVLGRLFKASETAFNGAALRMRADLADLLIPKAEQAGVDMTNPEQASQALGKTINSLTGRGDIGKLNIIGKEINNAFFSVKFLKANLDTLFQGIKAPLSMLTDKGVELVKGEEVARTPAEKFARKQSAVNLMKIVGTTAGIMYIANTLWPGSVDFDPRSTNFGKIKIGKNTVDITGGLGSLATLAARIVPTTHNGKLSFWTKNKNGVYTDLLAGKYGQQNAFDVINSFWAGKLSPIAGVAHDVWTGNTYNNTKPTVGGEAAGLVTPIPVSTYQQLNSPNAATTLGLMILDGLGLSVTSEPKKK